MRVLTTVYDPIWHVEAETLFQQEHSVRWNRELSMLAAGMRQYPLPRMWIEIQDTIHPFRGVNKAPRFWRPMFVCNGGEVLSTGRRFE